MDSSSERVEIIAPEISLLITRAEITRVGFDFRKYNKTWTMGVCLQLYAGSKPVTTLTLGSDCAEDDPDYVNFSDEMRRRFNGILALIKKSANISIERMQPMLEGEIDES